MKILVVEDDKFLSGAYRIKLVKMGFEVQLASDGDEALTRLQTFTPDLILLDLIMPGKDGFSTLIRLKSDARWKKIPVIVASNLGQKEDIDKSMALGANDFIVKSDTSLEQVVNKINKLLGLPQISLSQVVQPGTPPSLATLPQAPQSSTQPPVAPPQPVPTQTTPPSQTGQNPQATQAIQPQPTQTVQAVQNSQTPQTIPEISGKEENVR